jgi:hypothetical protein
VSEMRIARVLSIVLAATALAFATVGTFAVTRQVKAYTSWPKVNAVVEEINVHGVGDNAYGNISVKLSLSNSHSERSVWDNKSFLPGRGARFAREYAVGTQHVTLARPRDTRRRGTGAGLESRNSIRTLVALDCLPLPFVGSNVLLAISAKSSEQPRLICACALLSVQFPSGTLWF